MWGSANIKQINLLDPSQLAMALRLGSIELLPYLDAICALIEKEESKLHALVEATFDRSKVLAQGKRLLQRFPKPENRPFLFGLPFGVKDIFRVEGIPTRCGSKLPSSLFQGAEASCVTHLKEAGAIVLGKTVTTEFAYLQPGPTRNPYNPEHTPGGSSSGSAAGVHKQYFPMALGTQTIGSIIRPAAYCGVAGFKPSYGRIPADGVIPFSPSADHIGFFCKEVTGFCFFAPFLILDWTIDNHNSIPRETALGIPEGPYFEQVSPNAKAHFEASIGKLKEKGFPIIHCQALDNIEFINESHMRMMSAEAARVHRTWYRDFKGLYGPETADIIEKGLKIDDNELSRLVSQKQVIKDKITQQMDHFGIDFWLTPAATDHAPKGLESTGSPVMNLPWTHGGFPAISIPCGLDSEGLPHGLQLVGRFYQDEALVQFAEKIQDTIKDL